MHWLARCALLALVAFAASRGALALDPYKPFDQYARDTWGAEQGLPDHVVQAMVQDPAGYLWIGTQQGLARFDGAAIRTYLPEDTAQLPNRRIESLLVDRAGRLWIGTILGIALYDGSGFYAVELHMAGESRVAIATRIWQFAELDDGTLVAATNLGLFRRVADDRFEHWPLVGEDPVTGVWRGRDALLVSHGGALLRIPLDGTVVERMGFAETGLVEPVRAYAEHQGATWVGTVDGLFRLVDGRFERLPLAGEAAPPRVRTLFAEPAGSLWIATDRYLLRLRPDGTVEHIDDVTFPISDTRAILLDREDNLWFGSFGRGATRVWDGWVDRYSRSRGLNDPIAWAVAPWTGDRLLVGTQSGVELLENGRFVRAPAAFDRFDERPVFALLVEDDVVWIGGGLGAFRVDTSTVPATPQELAALDGTSLGTVYAIFRDRGGRVWVLSERGPLWVTERGLVAAPVEPAEAARVWRTIQEDRDGNLYAGGPNGLFRWEDDRFVLMPVKYLGRPFSSYSLLSLADGTLIVGGQNPALWFARAGASRTFGLADGLPNNNAYSLTLDRYGMLWVSGAKGLYRVPLADFDAYASGRITRLRTEMVLSTSGLEPGAQLAKCCNGGGRQSAALIGDDLWLTSDDGVVRVPVSGMARNSVVPEVRIERVRYAGRWQEAADGATLALPLGARNLDVEFSVLSFRDPKTVHAKFQLVGFDPDWRVLENPLFRRASYTNLPPGNYTFRVMGANDAGAWNEIPAALAFTVPRRFAETWMPWALGALGLVLAMYAGYRYRLGVLQAQRNTLERKVRERTAELDAANHALHEASETDQLTALRNRRYLHDHLPSDIADLVRRLRAGSKGIAFGFVVADVDHFKSINDRHGHVAGDAVLRQFAALLKGAVRDGDYAVRWGGEEFLLVLRDVQRAGLADIVESIRKRVAETPFELGDGAPSLRVTASFGCIAFPLLADRIDALPWQAHVELADAALYKAKRSGRNTWAECRTARDGEVGMTDALLAGPAADLVTAGAVAVVLRAKDLHVVGAGT